MQLSSKNIRKKDSKNVRKKDKKNKSKNRKKVRLSKKPKKHHISLRKFGMNNENEFITALNNENSNMIVEWVCKNMNYAINTSTVMGKSNNYIVYNIKTNINDSPSLPSKIKHKRENIFVITPNNFIGSGTWGKVYDAYIFDKEYYNKKSNNVLKDAERNKSLKIPGFVNTKIKKDTSKAFLLLLKYQYLYIDTLIRKNIDNKYAIKIPINTELDGESLKDILFEPAIHGSVCLNKIASQYVPMLKTIFLKPNKKPGSWNKKCLKVISSNKIQPKAQISILNEYSCFLITSGLKYNGVPI